METILLSVVIIAAVAAGAWLGWFARGVALAATVAATAGERDLLAQRVVELDRQASRSADAAAVVAPLGATLERVERQVHELERSRTAQFAQVERELAFVGDSARRLGEETGRLAGSLHSSTVRGSWGELQLRRVLELSGLLARCDFDEQVEATNADGIPVRPDVVVHLPGERHVVIDAKAPMTAFLAAQAEDLSEPDRAEQLRRHAAALRRHVDALAGKQYWSAVPGATELVLCFVPGEAILAAALAQDPGLHERAMAGRVALVSPASLLAALRTVAAVWQQESVADGARQLLTLGRELYARLGTLAAHTTAVGNALGRSVTAYNRLVGTLETRVLVSARRLEGMELGAREITVTSPLDAVPRALTAPELWAALAEDAGRAELDFTPSQSVQESAGQSRAG